MLTDIDYSLGTKFQRKKQHVFPGLVQTIFWKGSCLTIAFTYSQILRMKWKLPFALKYSPTRFEISNEGTLPLTDPTGFHTVLLFSFFQCDIIFGCS